MQQEKIPTVIITGAGPGGLTLYHALMKNKDKKEFNVKIFERESGPKDRWQGYHIGLSTNGVRSLLNCIPCSIASSLPKAMPNPIPDEYHGYAITDHMGNTLQKPPSKQVKDIYELAKNPEDHLFSTFITYRDRFRDVLLEGVPVQWGKKCIGYEETEEGVWVKFEDGSQEFCDILVGADGINSSVRKQKVPQLEVLEFDATIVTANLLVPKHLMDRLIKVDGNSLIQKNLGLNGDSTVLVLRLIPIEQEQGYDGQIDSNELHYRTTMSYIYPSELDNDVEIDDSDPASVIEHVKDIIRKLRPECEMTDILLDLWDLPPKKTPPEGTYPFKTYHPIQRRRVRDINPLTVSSWTSNRITLMGDAVHAMSPILGLGTSNAIQDADILSQALLNYSPENYLSCIKEYENEMLKRATADVVKSREVTLRIISPVGYFGYIVRNSRLKLTNILMNVVDFVTNHSNHL